MEAIQLSITALLFKWATLCVDWFMDLFADPEYYWVHETYPSDNVVVKARVTGKARIAPKWPVWIKGRRQDPVLGALIHLKRMLLHILETCTNGCFALFDSIWAGVDKNVRPIVV
ncbi:hypothetical protein SAMN06265379_101426 [Saccharicrinis carchari]|uniref:Uncharacterized protein n=1 Tax=Saccharicrinis carchari TaxID=1168039 RepID=A0A521AUZ2_SACCC|nr:hypothetical protein [Saccharicrinis carchari]SMO38672.1 hypothetical protein SAMN06265379_101426 [Saccharicrinis carchari]